MYHVMTCMDPAVGYLATLEYDFSDDPDPLRDWMAGERFEIEPLVPIRATIAPRVNTVLAEMWQVPLPIMSRRLHGTLVAAGVGNLEVFAAQLVDSSGYVDEGFVAFNIVGLVSADAVRATLPGGVLIDGFTIGEARARSALMFRLAEACNTIVVHRSLKQAIESAGISTMSFFDTAEWTA